MTGPVGDVAALGWPPCSQRARESSRRSCAPVLSKPPFRPVRVRVPGSPAGEADEVPPSGGARAPPGCAVARQLKGRPRPRLGPPAVMVAALTARRVAALPSSRHSIRAPLPRSHLRRRRRARRPRQDRCPIASIAVDATLPTGGARPTTLAAVTAARLRPVAGGGPARPSARRVTGQTPTTRPGRRPPPRPRGDEPSSPASPGRPDPRRVIGATPVPASDRGQSLPRPGRPHDADRPKVPCSARREPPHDPGRS